MEEKATVAVIFDFNRTIYDPDTKDLLPGARELLEALYARHVPLYLISKGDESRPQLLQELDLAKFFRDMLFVERKDPALFLELARRANAHPRNTYVVGDYLHKEIRSGNQSGMRTIWLKYGKFSQMEPEVEADQPWQIVNTMEEVLPLIT